MALLHKRGDICLIFTKKYELDSINYIFLIVFLLRQ